jgi:hypothetical protein
VLDALGQAFAQPHVVVLVGSVTLVLYYRPELTIRLESVVERTRSRLLVETLLYGGFLIVASLGLRALGLSTVATGVTGAVLVGIGFLSFAILWLADRTD